LEELREFLKIFMLLDEIKKLKMLDAE
jgi:hypothetical protein